MPSVKRVTLSLDPDVASALTKVSCHLNVSKSSFVNQILGETVISMAAIMDSLPKDPTKNDVIRARGKSADMVKSRVDDFVNLLDGSDDLFGGLG